MVAQIQSSLIDTQVLHRPPSSVVKLPRRHGKVVLGREVLAAVHEDMSKIQLPSWVNPAPIGFGLKSHGKLSADQWRSVCIINLPITLIRLWGKEVGRKQQMLENFLCLIAAIDIGTAKSISQQSIKCYNQMMLAYLTTMKILYPEAKIQPNHHYALHLSEFMKNFGPVHSIQTFGFERMNHQLQLTNTNRKYGQ